MRKKISDTEQILIMHGFQLKKSAPIEEQTFKKPDIESFLIVMRRISEDYCGVLTESSWSGRGNLDIKITNDNMLNSIISVIYKAAIDYENNILINIRINKEIANISIDFAGRITGNVIKL